MFCHVALDLVFIRAYCYLSLTTVTYWPKKNNKKIGHEINNRNIVTTSWQLLAREANETQYATYY